MRVLTPVIEFAIIAEAAGQRSQIDRGSMNPGNSLRLLGLLVLLGFAISGCTSVNADVLKQRRSVGVTQSFDRPADDLYTASLVALRTMQSTLDWHELRVSEEDRAHGTIVAERRLDSAILPGVGTREAIGIFVTPRSKETSDVTVVAIASDQLAGRAGTSLQSQRTAHAYVFPGIEDALKQMPERPHQQLSTPSSGNSAQTAVPQSVTRSGAEEAPRNDANARNEARSSAPEKGTSGVVGNRGARSSSTQQVAEPATTQRDERPSFDRLYEVLRSSGSWRPLVREVGESGDEEIRIGRWAKLTATGDQVVLTISNSAGAAAKTARLALELKQAGFEIDVKEEPHRDRIR